MNLKTYISLKLILFVVFVIIIGFLTSSINSESRRLKSENEELIFHKKVYKSIIELPVNDVEGKKKLLQIVKSSDSQESIEENYFSSSTLLYILLLVFSLGIYFMDILNKKIEILKNEESDVEKQQML
ncbi:hypothetical protein [Flavobacterium terrigena]|uniref:Uncharacterized protein n=1 Tax=Flavobacterium terrigena TaxID=402734 RepID=A0A1H6Y617_9FLAO|nr:hypothetical protein [Flavobacterium terrigena]SEJ32622.1 hypothetical protein SAMN05660918_0024 [Flavobacterium terrigena]